MQNLESVSFCPTKCTWNQDFSHSALDFYHCCKLLRVVVNHSYLLPCDLWLNGSAASAANCFVWCRLGAGTTRFCAGIVSVAKPLSIESKMADYSNSLYERLEEETGIKTGKRSLVSHNRRCKTLRANMFRHWNQRSFAVCVCLFSRFCSDRFSLFGSKSGPAPVFEASGIQAEVSDPLFFSHYLLYVVI